MAITIKSVSYLPVKPIVEAEAESTADLADLTGVAEGSTCKISSTTYTYDEVNGWAEAGSQGKELPDAPENNGAYVLTCTVSGSGAAYTWESTTPGG